MNSKGVTPVVATVLLLTISVAATGTAYTFIVNAQQQAAESYEEQFSQQERQQNTDFDIETVYESNGDVVLFVRNTGSIPVLMKNDDGNSVVNLYIDGEQTDWEFLEGDPTPGERTLLAVGETAALDTEYAFPGDGEEIELQLIGRYGTEAFYTCTSDGSSC